MIIITPTKTVKTENGPISRGSQSEVSMVRDIWGKRFTKKVNFAFRVKERRGDGWGKWRTEGWIEVSIYKEVKLVHEVKMEVDSRDEARHTEKSDL